MSLRSFPTSTIIPNNILQEIFIHCLPPRRPLKLQNPKTTEAPLILCHICSSWRKVALASANLWCHLFFCLTIVKDDSKTALLKDEIDFIQWWRKNQGATIAPILHLSAEVRKREEITQELSEEGMVFLLRYIMSAQYLDLDPIFWMAIQAVLEAGHPINFPHLLTLAKSEWGQDDPFYCVQNLLGPQSAPALRRLYINDDTLNFLEEDEMQIPAIWSKLTHISLHKTAISPDSWSCLLRGVPNLEWAYIDISEVSDFEDDEYTAPTEQYSLPRLSTLCVAFRDDQKSAPQFSFGTLFTKLLLPAVHTLSLSWFISDVFYDHDTTAILHSILESAPAVTTLALAENFLALVDPGTSHADLSTREHVVPIWMHAQNLTHLQIEVPQEGTRERTKQDVEQVLGIFVSDTLFAPGSWLGLSSANCPIRRISIVDDCNSEAMLDDETDGKSETSDSEDGDSGDELSNAESNNTGNSIGKYMVGQILERAHELPHITFQLESASVRHIAASVAEIRDSGLR